MGTGKTEAAITYMNEHKEKKSIYITPYLAESNRIKEGCPELHFVEPSNKLSEQNASVGRPMPQEPMQKQVSMAVILQLQLPAPTHNKLAIRPNHCLPVSLPKHLHLFHPRKNMYPSSHRRARRARSSINTNDLF